jgi:hypothetical protein
MAELSAPDPPTQPPPSRDPKAEAAAAKAYAKAQRPWYKKKRWILSIGAVLLIVIIAAASSGGGDDSSEPATPASQQETPAQNEPAAEEEPAQDEPSASGGPTADFPITDGDWRLDSMRVQDDGLGDFGGTARVTYAGDNPEGGTNLFTVTVFVGGKDVAVLNGSADSVEPGQAATVQLISSDKFVAGPYKYDFQADL